MPITGEEFDKFLEIGNDFQRLVETPNSICAAIHDLAVKAGLEIFPNKIEGLTLAAAEVAHELAEQIFTTLGVYTSMASPNTSFSLHERMQGLVGQAYLLATSSIRMALSEILTGKDVREDETTFETFIDLIGSIGDPKGRLYYPVRRKPEIMGIAYINYASIGLLLRHAMPLSGAKPEEIEPHIAKHQQIFVDTFMNPPGLSEPRRGPEARRLAQIARSNAKKGLN
jgi:hypothetical protein